jgi:5-carboxymethyl-2-hydroxymuconate isomerase
MPHIVVEYSTRLAERLDVQGLLLELHAIVGKSPTFEEDRIKTRAIPIAQRVVGSDPNREFIHVALSFSSGRDEGIRRALGRDLLNVLVERVGGSDLRVSRSVEIRQFEPGMYFNDYDLKEGGGQEPIDMLRHEAGVGLDGRRAESDADR